MRGKETDLSFDLENLRMADHVIHFAAEGRTISFLTAPLWTDRFVLKCATIHIYFQGVYRIGLINPRAFSSRDIYVWTKINTTAVVLGSRRHRSLSAC